MRRSISQLSRTELQTEIERMDGIIEKHQHQDTPEAKELLTAVRALRFAFECRLQKHESAPIPQLSNVVDLAEYRARRNQK